MAGVGASPERLLIAELRAGETVLNSSNANTRLLEVGQRNGLTYSGG